MAIPISLKRKVNKEFMQVLTLGSDTWNLTKDTESQAEYKQERRENAKYNIQHNDRGNTSEEILLILRNKTNRR